MKIACVQTAPPLEKNQRGTVPFRFFLEGRGGLYTGYTKRAKLLAHDWSSSPLATACAMEKFFCDNGVSFRDS